MSGKRKPNGDIGPADGDSADLPAGAPVERELPAELRPFEAALASLSPNADRLDHDLIMFQAGQRSVAGHRHSASRARSLAMPAGLTAMTIIAATLLAMLITRPVIDRVEIIRIPVVETVESTPMTGRTTTLVKAAQRADYSHYLSDHPRSRAVTLQLVARMLEQDLRSGSGPVFDTTGPSEEVPQAEPPTPYLQQLRSMLDDQARASGGSHLPGATAWPDTLDIVSVQSYQVAPGRCDPPS